MKKEREITVNLVGKPKWKNNNKLKANRTNGAAVVKPQSVQKKPFQFKCYFCKKPGHMKKDCNGYKSWVVKRGIFLPKPSFSIEINLINVQPFSFWLDSGSPLHITNTLQGFIRKRAPRSDENHVCVGNGLRVAVKAIGVLKLDLGSGNVLFLDNVFFVPSMRRNLLSVSLLVKNGCSFFIDNFGIKISRNSQLIGSGSIVNDYLQLHCNFPKEILSIENT